VLGDGLLAACSNRHHNTASPPPSTSYSFTFTKTGSYSYECQIHTFMTGTITVNP
jgi:plastocyanin